FGDSLTHGTGASDAESYPAVLAVLLGCETVNAGVPGEVTSEGLGRLPGTLLRHSPDLVVLCHGGNDMLRKVPDQEIESNLRRMIELSHESGAEVLLLGVPRPGLLLRAPDFYGAVAAEAGAAYDKKTIARVLSRGALKSDPIHPNASGYREIAEKIARRLEKRR
ncbi:MAG: GDSL-type esterase/lipase family protein, partial [Kiritimatiellae bacterium]|nr:GDSL-type esterase/lipase family protein [Kiritimatiellia bacterium]